MAVDPNIKKKADDIRNKIYGKEVRESLASGLEAMSSDVVENTGRQDNVESQFQDVIENTTDKDVISAPEIIAARDGNPNLKARLDKEHDEVTAQLAQIVVQSTQFTTIEDAINHCYSNNLNLRLMKDYRVNTNNISGVCSIEGNNKKLTFVGTKKDIPIKSKTSIDNVVFDLQQINVVGSLFKGSEINNFKGENLTFINDEITSITRLFTFIKSNNIEFKNVKTENVSLFIETQKCKNVRLDTFHLTHFYSLINAIYDQTLTGTTYLTNENLWTEDVFVENVIAVNTLEQCNAATAGTMFSGGGVKNFYIKNIYVEYPMRRFVYISAGENVNIENVESKGHASFKFVGWHHQDAFLTSDGFNVKNVAVKGDRGILPTKSRCFLETYFSKNVNVEGVTIEDYPSTGDGLFYLGYELTNFRFKDVVVDNVSTENTTNNKIFYILRNTVKPGGGSLPDLTDGVDFNALLKQVNINNIEVKNCLTVPNLFLIVDDHTNASIGYQDITMENIHVINCPELTSVCHITQPSKNVQIKNCTHVECPKVVIPTYKFNNVNNTDIILLTEDTNDDTDNVVSAQRIDSGSTYKRTGKPPIIAGTTTKGIRTVVETGNSIHIEFLYTIDSTIDTNGARTIHIKDIVNGYFLDMVEIWDSVGTYYKAIGVKGNVIEINPHTNVVIGYGSDKYSVSLDNTLFEVRDLHKVSKEVKVIVKLTKR